MQSADDDVPGIHLRIVGGGRARRISALLRHDGEVADPVSTLRSICLALPDVVEKVSHGEVAFFVQLTPKSTKQFAAVDDHHHGGQYLSFWCPAPAGGQEELIAANPEQYFRPPYVGHRGWVGVRLDNSPDWAEVTEIVSDAYRCVASAKLLAKLDSSD